MNAGELVDDLMQVPRDSVVYFLIKGSGVSKLAKLTSTPAEPKPDTGCEHCDDTSQLNPDLFLPHVLLEASEDAQVNKLVAAIDALVDAAPDRKAALRIKQAAGVYLTPKDIADISDPW